MKRPARAEADPPAVSKTSIAYAALRRRILDGVHRPGERLRLAQIAGELGVSEMPVREALRLLQKDGLVVVHLNRGAEVARLSYQRGLDVLEARMTLELAAALTALPRHDAASIDGLGRLLLAVQEAAVDPVRFALCNRAWATALFAPCPNAFLTQLIQDLWDQIWQAASTLVFVAMPHRVPETIAENTAILAAVARGDPATLQSAMTRRSDAMTAAFRTMVDKESGVPARAA